MFAHRPDYDTPVEETTRAFSDAISLGLCHYWGTSEWPADRIEAARSYAEKHGFHSPVCEQPEYNILNKVARTRVEVEYKRLIDTGTFGLGLTVW